VLLRPLEAADASPYAAAFRDDPDLGRLLGIAQDPDERSIRERVDGHSQRAEDGKGVELAVVAPATSAFCGSVILHSFDWPNRHCEVGFWVIPEVRNRGVGSRAVSPAVTWALETLDLLRAEMTTTPENLAAPALAERLGFVREGVLRARSGAARGHHLVWRSPGRMA
jgi:RimJ/RimL family protein N-acetyltransferase